MGYNIYITRAEDIYENEDSRISLKEWKDIIRADNELEAIDKLETTLPNGLILSQEQEGMAIWEYTIENEKQKIYLLYSDGNIFSKYGDMMINKMKKIAIKLQAKVIGEEGEVY
ncbi:hypothetical protein QE450_001919 [Paenibacillus sp. SORGH_AS306]|uniref:hypothetical protein n=1 Tax=unclassified Paenibacillus TaxID=185978 RepID=UPI00278A9EE7|nr:MULTISPECIES: hypothetical protein [unclassified Paenibacillus]MDQ1234421.1 hypothetical protein [Paenibacillus sp. SORGH_AS_0306]MDR6111468.1 hypothetical protein [Paenibacillus sp. SORGH_AS_0338]